MFAFFGIFCTIWMIYLCQRRVSCISLPGHHGASIGEALRGTGHWWSLGALVAMFFFVDTVDGRNPAPPGILKTLYINNGIIIILGGAGLCPSTVGWPNCFSINIKGMNLSWITNSIHSYHEKDSYCLRRQYYCWWFRNPKQPSGMCKTL